MPVSVFLPIRQAVRDGIVKKGNTTPNFMYNEHATWTSDSWGYTNLRFWPIDDKKITFFAYAPYESKPEVGTDQKITLSGQNAKGAPTITFEVKTSNNWKDMIDLVTDCHYCHNKTKLMKVIRGRFSSSLVTYLPK